MIRREHSCLKAEAEIDKKVEDLVENDFDKYGFALIKRFWRQKMYAPDSSDLRNWEEAKWACHIFYTTNQRNNLWYDDYHKEAHSKQEIRFEFDGQKITDYEEDFEYLKGKNIVETIKYFLQKYPKNTTAILREMPSCLYENKEVAKEIFSCIQKSNETILESIDVIKERCANIVKAKGRDVPKPTPEENFERLVQIYDKYNVK